MGGSDSEYSSEAEELVIESDIEDCADEKMVETCEETGEELIEEVEVEPGSEAGLPEQPMQKIMERSIAQRRRHDFSYAFRSRFIVYKNKRQMIW